MNAVVSKSRNYEVRPGNTLVLPGQTPDGRYILSVLLKRTYRFADQHKCGRADKDRKIISGDQFFKDPMNSSVRYESDFVPFKLATDVVLNSRAHAPKGRPVRELVAAVTVGQHQKEILIIGNRSARYRSGGDPTFTDPEPFGVMEIRYENAYGGVDIYSDRKMHCIYARNHLGKGFVIKNARDTVDYLPLPNIESIQDRLTPERLCVGHFMHWERQPMPEGFGWVAKHWQPRSLLAGVMPGDKAVEAELRAAYTPLVPPEQRELYAQTQLPDMDFRFFNGASLGMALPYLKGDEIVRVENLSRESVLTFKLPGDFPKLTLDVGFGVQEPPAVLQTVMIHMEERELDIVWRGVVAYAGPDWLPQMRKMEVRVL